MGTATYWSGRVLVVEMNNAAFDRAFTNQKSSSGGFCNALRRQRYEGQAQCYFSSVH
jgi:hypothetical protein